MSDHVLKVEMGEFTSYERHDGCFEAFPWTIVESEFHGWWLGLQGHELVMLQKSPTLDAAKSLAEKLNEVLAPPVGTQP